MDSISQNSIEVDVQVNNADALDKLANDMSNIKKLAGRIKTLKNRRAARATE